MVATSLRPARRATQGFFLISGVAVATWAPMVPFVKARLGLDEGSLGLVLLSLGVGSTGSMPLAGFLSDRFGHRVVLALSAIPLAVALPLLALAPSTPALVATLICFGAAAGITDVAMNAHAVDVERLHGAPLMSGFHALFSLGGLTGAAMMAGLLAAGAPLVGTAVGIALAMLVVVASQWRHLLDGRAAAPPPGERPLRPRMVSLTAIGLGGLCLVVFLAEGAMLDWSAVFLRGERGVDIDRAGVGYAAFSIAMTAGRLLGDRITAALGPRQIVRAGSLIAAIGLGLAAGLPWAATALAGFVLIGIGASNIVPVLFSAAGRIPGVAPGVAIAAVTTLGYAGMLAGPAAIGLVARATSLPIALGGVAGLLALVSLTGGLVIGKTSGGR
ncbi:MAG TPA: MFS transporter [Kofleriaceae bacterium]